MPRQKRKLPRARRLHFQSLEARHLLASLWRNPADAIDVTNDGQIGAFDALEIINDLNTSPQGYRDLPPVRPIDRAFIDPTGDRQVTAFDALAVINHLNKRPAGTYVLEEKAGQFADQQSIIISAGTLPAGARTFRLHLQPEFDVTDALSSMEDMLAVYLFDPATGQTVIDAGSSGSSLFTMSGANAVAHNGLVHWDGTHLNIDLSNVAAETLELRLQLFNLDTDNGSKITIGPASNEIDPQGVPRTPGTLRSPPNQPAATADDVGSYQQMPLRVDLENPIYNPVTGQFTAEVRLVNDTDINVANGIVRLPGVTASAAVNESGVIDNVPYWNFASVIGAGGLEPGAASGWLKIELVLENGAFQWRPDARGYNTPESLARLGVFRTTFSEAQERQIFHFPLLAGEGVLTLQMKSPGNHTVRMLNPDGTPVSSGYVNDYNNKRLIPFYATVSGDYRFEVISSVPGDFAVAFQKVGNLPTLELGDEVQGYIDPRFGPKVFQFYGKAGQRLVFENRAPVDYSNYTKWQVIAPFDSFLNPLVEQYPNGNLEVEIRFDGWHHLVLSAPELNNTIFRPYDYLLRSPIVIEVPLDFDVIESGEFEQFNEARAYTFTGVPGQLIVMDQHIQSPTNPYLGTYLLSPDGEQLPVDQFGGPLGFRPNQPFLIDQAGTWKLVVQGNNAGTFSLRVQNVADLNELAAGATITGDVELTTSDYVRVWAVRGERLTLVSNNGNSVQTQVFGPTGVALQQVGANQFLVTESGDQLLRIYTTAGGTVAYDLTLQQQIDAPVAPIGFDIDYSGTSNPGTTTVGTFSASAGTQMMFDKFALTTTPPNYSVRITGPGFDQTFAKDSGVITLARSGTYTMAAVNNGTVAVPYGFRVVDLAAMPLLSHGDRIETTFTTPGKTLIRRVEGQIGERLLLASLDFSQLNELSIRLQTDTGPGSDFFAHPQVEDYNFVATKTHYLTIEQKYDEPELRLIAATTDQAAALPLDTPFSDILGPNGGLQLYEFTAERGDRLYLDTRLMTNTISAGLLGAADGLLDLNEPKLFHVETSGVNYLWLRPWAANDSLYTLQATFGSQTVNPINLGSVASGTLSEGELRTYELDVPAGAVVLFDGLGGNATVNIFDEHGFYVHANINTAADRMFTAQIAGKYRIMVSDSTLNFSFRMVDVRNATLLPQNTSLTGSILPGTATQVWRVPVTVGQGLIVDSNATAGSPFRGELSLYAPNGYQQASSTETVNNDLITTAYNTGDYYLTISPGFAPFNFDLQVRGSTAIVEPLTLGTTVSGTLDEPGDEVLYVFQGTRGQHVRIEGTTNNTVFNILNPDSAINFTTEGTSYVLPTTGEYRIRVKAANQQAIANYRLQVTDVATLPALPLNTPISGNTAQGEWLLYRVPAAIGDRLAFDSLSVTGVGAASATWQLINPQGNPTFLPTARPLVDGDQSLSLMDDGDYLLVVRLPAADISYSFQANVVAASAVTVAGLNQTYTGTVTNTNTVNIPFTARAGQRVLLDILDADSLPPARLLGPDGSVVNLNAENDAWATNDRLLVMPTSGTYQIEISSTIATPRDFRFRLVDASALPLTAHNTPFTANFNLPYQGDVWAFEATVGDLLSFDIGVTPGSPAFRIVQPDGKPGPNVISSPLVFQMTQTGRYYLVMDGKGITPWTKTAQIRNVANLPLLTTEDPIDVHFTGREWHFYSFDLSVGDRVYFTSLTEKPALMLSHFSGPDARTYNITFGSGNSNAFTVMQPGRYTLILQHASSTPIDFTFRIRGLELKEFYGEARG